LSSCLRPHCCLTVRAGVLTLLLGAHGCTEPRFPPVPDAGETYDAAIDAALSEPTRPLSDAAAPALTEDGSPGAPAVHGHGVLPAMAAALRGTYARRSTFFAVDSGTRNAVMSRGAELALIRIEDDGVGGLRWRTQLCSLTIDDAIGTKVIVTHPEALPTVEQVLRAADDGSFSAPLVRVAMGYVPERFDDPDCQAQDGSTRRPRFDDQTWPVDPAQYPDGEAWTVGGTCACPASASDLPGIPSDCRLTDSDADGAPGLTVTAVAPLVATRFSWSVALEYTLAYEAGSRAQDGSLEVTERHVLRPRCVDRAAQTCASGQSLPCRTETSETLIVPVDGSIPDCAALQNAKAQLFPGPIPGFPSQECVGAP
jgi:hypothetical protein